MPESKTYLNVPYAQKDVAKTLGARWDAANKKWYVPADKDIALFAQWQTVALAAPATTGQPKTRATPKKSASATHGTQGVMTFADDNNFVAYHGTTPPWE